MKAIVDDEIFDFISNFRWVCFPGRNTFYARTLLRGQKDKQVWIFMHHLVQGKPLKPFVSEHKNGNGLDNRKCNLTFLTVRRNSLNTYKKRQGLCSSSYPGVSWSKSNDKWRVMFLKNGKHFFVGNFKNEFEASEAYKEELIKIEVKK